MPFKAQLHFLDIWFSEPVPYHGSVSWISLSPSLLTAASCGIGSLRELNHACKSLFYDPCETWCLVGSGESKTLESRLSLTIDRFLKQKLGTEEGMGVFFLWIVEMNIFIGEMGNSLHTHIKYISDISKGICHYFLNFSVSECLSGCMSVHYLCAWYQKRS